MCIEMPHKKPIIEYSDGQFQFKVPFIIYADFESILEPIQTTLGNHQLAALMYIPHLDGVLIPSSLMEKSQILLRNIEERIVLASFVNT